MLIAKKVFLNFQASDDFFFLKWPFLEKYTHAEMVTALWKLTANTPVCHTQSVRKAWDLKSSKYGQFLRHCHFKHKRKASEFEGNVTDVRKENILLSLAHKMKYLITGLSFLVENPQALLENTIPLAAQPPPPKKKLKDQAHPF